MKNVSPNRRQDSGVLHNIGIIPEADRICGRLSLPQLWFFSTGIRFLDAFNQERNLLNRSLAAASHPSYMPTFKP